MFIIANSWIFAAYYIKWPGRPDVFSQYTFGQTTPIVLYIGSSPQRRAEFFIDYTLSADAHVAPRRSTNVTGVGIQPFYDNTLTYRTNQLTASFIDQNAYVISERALVKDFGVVEFCNGYIFPHPAGHICQAKETLVEMVCGDTPLEICTANVVVEVNRSFYKSVPMQLSVSNEFHIIPDQFSANPLGSLTILADDAGPLRTNITMGTSDVIFAGSSVILSLPKLQSSFRHSHDFGNITVYQLVSDDENTEALFYSIFVIFVFAYWVHVSRNITHTLYSENAAESLIAELTNGIPSVLIANISGSLAIASILSSLPQFSHAHVFLPIEATILIGKHGDYDSSFSRWLYPVYQIVASIVVFLGCFYLYVFRHKNRIMQQNPNSFLDTLILRVYSKLTGKRTPKNQTIPMFTIPALRYCFELQLLNAAFTTVPPPAGSAFRIAMGGFIAIALQCIFGRDANFIFNFRNGGTRRQPPNNDKALQVAVTASVLLVASISLFYGTVLMMGPLLWVTNVAPLSLSLGVAACFLVVLAIASFVVSAPGKQSAIAASETSQKYM